MNTEPPEHIPTTVQFSGFEQHFESRINLRSEVQLLLAISKFFESHIFVFVLDNTPISKFRVVCKGSL